MGAGATICVIDDNAMTRTLLSETLRSLGFVVVGSADTAAEGMQLIADHRPEIALVDLDLGPGPTGVDFVRTANKRFPDIKVAILTSYEDPRLFAPDMAIDNLELTYLLKRDILDADSLAAAIRDLENGTLRRTVTQTQLTDSQAETLRLIAEGLSNAEIARRRVVSERAVEDTIRRLAATLKVQQVDGGNTRALLLREYYRMIGATGI